MIFMSWRRSALYDVNDCGPLLLTWLTWPEVFSQKLCLGKFFTFSHKTRTYVLTYVVQCTPELMDHPVRVMILKLLYYYFQTTYASKSENSSPFIIYYIPPPPCFGLYFVFTPYVMGFGVLAEELAASGAWLCIKIAVMCYTSDCRNYTGHIPFIVWKNDLW